MKILNILFYINTILNYLSFVVFEHIETYFTILNKWLSE